MTAKSAGSPLLPRSDLHIGNARRSHKPSPARAWRFNSASDYYFAALLDRSALVRTISRMDVLGCTVVPYRCTSKPRTLLANHQSKTGVSRRCSMVERAPSKRCKAGSIPVCDMVGLVLTPASLSSVQLLSSPSNQFLCRTGSTWGKPNHKGNQRAVWVCPPPSQVRSDMVL